MKDFYKILLNILKENKCAMVVSVISQTGSTPRGSGAKMAVKANGEIYGTIGGGTLEYDAINVAKEIIAAKKSFIKDYKLSSEEVAELGMVCGGDMKVMFRYFEFERETEELLNGIINLKKPGWLITEITDGKALSRLSFKGDDDFSEYQLNYCVITEIDDKEVITEPVDKVLKAYIFGGGHIGLEVAWILNRLNFSVTVIDDRVEFADYKRFFMADNVVVGNYDDNTMYDSLLIDQDSYIVILTRGHLHDRVVLENVLKTDAKYIGMIGSIAKRDSIFFNLLNA